MNNLSEREWGYVAGILDGEGTIGFHKRNEGRSIQQHIQVGNTDESLIDWLVAHLGGRKAFHRAPSSNARQCFEWRVTDRAVIEYILHNTLSSLVIKRVRAEAMLEYFSLVPLKGSGDRYTDEERAAQNSFADRFAELNRRGRT